VLIERVLKEGVCVAAAAEAFSISERTVYRWLKRYREGGEAALQDRSSRPMSSPKRTPEQLEARILKLRRKRHTGREIADELSMARSTVGVVLRRHGVHRLRLLAPSEPVVRYEKQRPGELLHFDTKKLGRIKGIGHRITGQRQGRVSGVGWEFAHVCVDDATRLAYVEVLGDERGETCAGFLQRAVGWFACLGVTAERLLTDNGSAYTSGTFATAAINCGLRHSFTRPYRPQTNGKAERFIQTLIRGWAYGRPYRTSAARTRALASWLDNYNHHRQHAGIGLTPIDKLRRTG